VWLIFGQAGAGKGSQEMNCPARFSPAAPNQLQRAEISEQVPLPRANRNRLMNVGLACNSAKALQNDRVTKWQSN
jgi:hypothetical protein